MAPRPPVRLERAQILPSHSIEGAVELAEVAFSVVLEAANLSRLLEGGS